MYEHLHEFIFPINVCIFYIIKSNGLLRFSFRIPNNKNRRLLLTELILSRWFSSS